MTDLPSPGIWGWVTHHKALSVAGVVLAILVVGSLGDASSDPDGDSSRPPGATSEGEDEGDDETGDPDRKRKPDRQPVAEEPPEPTYLVSSVVDGDTVDLANGETVRLVGIDTPEVGECGYDKARNRLVALVEGERVTLVRSDEDRDRYGRLLRYVDAGPVDAGLRLLQDGLAIARYDSRDGYGFHPREPEYIREDRGAPNITCHEPRRFTPQQPPSGCASGYSPCVPVYPPDVDCADVDGPISVRGSDPHGLDADDDGVACE